MRVERPSGSESRRWRRAERELDWTAALGWSEILSSPTSGLSRSTGSWGICGAGSGCGGIGGSSALPAASCRTAAFLASGELQSARLGPRSWPPSSSPQRQGSRASWLALRRTQHRPPPLRAPASAVPCSLVRPTWCGCPSWLCDTGSNFQAT